MAIAMTITKIINYNDKDDIGNNSDDDADDNGDNDDDDDNNDGKTIIMMAIIDVSITYKLLHVLTSFLILWLQTIVMLRTLLLCRPHVTSWERAGFFLSKKTLQVLPSNPLFRNCTEPITTLERTRDNFCLTIRRVINSASLRRRAKGNVIILTIATLKCV